MLNWNCFTMLKTCMMFSKIHNTLIATSSVHLNPTPCSMPYRFTAVTSIPPIIPNTSIFNADILTSTFSFTGIFYSCIYRLCGTALNLPVLSFDRHANLFLQQLHIYIYTELFSLRRSGQIGNVALQHVTA